MNIALIGYGKMGRTIESLGRAQGHAFPVIIDEENTGDLHSEKFSRVDVAIEFSVPDAAPANILTCMNQGVPVVSGTTGWNQHLKEVTKHCSSTGGALFYASNFSIGVNILFALNRQLAGIMNQFPSYRASIREVHHIHKKDAPSGTAISLAEAIVARRSGLSGWSLDAGDDPAVIPVEAIREDEVKGTHTVRYESSLDSITLNHNAKSRDAFAAGALLAADFIRGRQGVFTMEDLLKL